MTKNIINFGQAEEKARKRDLEIEQKQFEEEHHGIDQDAVDEALKVLSKATGGKEIYIGTKKSPQSKVRFAQIMQENMKFLSKQEYLTLSEKGFLIDIAPYISFYSNSIVFDVKAKNVVPMNISELAKELERPRDRTSKLINALVKKGILAKAESGIEGSNAKAYSLFVNPHVIFAGDKDNVPEHLQIIFFKAMKMPILKQLPNKLFKN
ncbi:helix-turn-helix domain-containing protein [Bacillus tropicus]|uniref:MarR family transcriptional regulator n=1 Tax=Bacillus tropicus TaxID=2026188 RepID=UPI000935BD58|nr:helix-turn-helix domain-containing protein [Bacillus tropicus]MED3381586.1 helix-turn-helix domain-containing protein [Bacillus tropicus]